MPDRKDDRRKNDRMKNISTIIGVCMMLFSAWGVAHVVRFPNQANSTITIAIIGGFGMLGALVIFPDRVGELVKYLVELTPWGGKKGE